MTQFTKDQLERAKANGVHKSTLYNRVINRGWDMEEAINTPPRKATTTSLEYSDEKLQRIRKQFPELLTYSVYKQIKEYGFSDKEVRTMYELGKSEFEQFLKNHRKTLEEAK